MAVRGLGAAGAITGVATGEKGLAAANGDGEDALGLLFCLTTKDNFGRFACGESPLAVDERRFSDFLSSILGIGLNRNLLIWKKRNFPSPSYCTFQYLGILRLIMRLSLAL